MPALTSCVLTINGGSSSIRFAVYGNGKRLRLKLAGKVDRIGQRGTTLSVTTPSGESSQRLSGKSPDTAIEGLLDWLDAWPDFASIKAVGHRVVHGLQRTEPVRVTARLLEELRRNTPFAPNHLPREIKLIEAFHQRHPKLMQIACFDTAFQRSMPRVARLLPIPRSYQAKGVERYGFHGLSYAYLLEELRRIDPRAARGRVIFAHLGNGASLAAVRGGRSIDTSMGFTPASGLVMGTRSGELDPGLLSFLSRREKMTPAGFDQMVNYESGLLGVSETSADIRDLIQREAKDVRAAEALALFCYQTKKWIGAYAAALGGVDTLVFAGGIGENSPLIRERICAGLDFLGIKLHRSRNAKNAALVSTDTARVAVRVIRTDEELMIARSVVRICAVTLAP